MKRIDGENRTQIDDKKEEFRLMHDIHQQAEECRRNHREQVERARRHAGSIEVHRDPTVPPNTIIFPETGQQIHIDDSTAELGSSIFGRQNDGLLNALDACPIQ